MSTNKPPVPLTRSFSLIPKSEEEIEEINLDRYFGRYETTDWDKLDHEYRCVILAEAGAGKTHEMLNHARQVKKQRRSAFFIRIENIASDFEDEFEVGTEAEFEQWLNSDQEAWFYLDSVDEARLTSPKAFEKAIKCFYRRIKSALQRTHIFVSSRPYAWRDSSDRRLLEEQLPYLQQSDNAEQTPPSETELQENTSQDEEALKVYCLNALSTEDIRLFADHRETESLDQLMDSLVRSNLTSMAERPFDLDMILDKWHSDKELGQRLEMLQHSIQRQLKEIDTNRAESQPLHLDTALKGARLIAAAVALTGEPGIKVPGSQSSDGITASELLGPTWPDQDVRALLERGIFNDVLYGHVRFRHREIRDLLAAEWFHDQLIKGASRRKIEHFFFAKQYGEQVIRPRLRSILVWLSILDAEIRHKAIAISPEIVTEGGDPSCLPYPERQKILIDIVHRIAADKSTQDVRGNSSIARIALPDLSETTLQLIEQYKENSEVIWFLGRLVWQGQMTKCLAALFEIALDTQMDTYARCASVRAVMTTGSKQESYNLWNHLNKISETLNPHILTEVVKASSCDSESVTLLLESIRHLPKKQIDQHISGFDELEFAIKDMISHRPIPSEKRASKPLLELLSGIRKIIESKIAGGYLGHLHFSMSNLWLYPIGINIAERFVIEHSPNALHRDSLITLAEIKDLTSWYGLNTREHKEKTGHIIQDWHELNDAIFWCYAEELRKVSITPTIDHKKFKSNHHLYHYDNNRFFDVLGFIENKPIIYDKLVALSLAFDIFSKSDRPESWLKALHETSSGIPELEESLRQLIASDKAQEQKAEESALQHDDRRRKEAERKQEEEKQYIEWIEHIRSNPETLRSLPDDPDAFNYDLFNLMLETSSSNSKTSRASGTNWQSLIEKFGTEVAHIYRDMTIFYWRRFTPKLRSEGDNYTQIPYTLHIAISGLEIEFNETPEFLRNLSNTDAKKALRYFVWEWNGFPIWFESIYETHPDLVLSAIWKELLWELENTSDKESPHYILSSLIARARWLYKPLSSHVFNWLQNNYLGNPNVLKQCLVLILAGDYKISLLVDLAQEKLIQSDSDETIAIWYSLWIFLDADTGLPSIDHRLANLPKEAAINQAQYLINELFESCQDYGFGFGNLEKVMVAQDLKRLHLLIHQYLLKTEDQPRKRVNGASRSGPRIHAQEARDALPHCISNLSGKDAFLALTQLSNKHPVKTSRIRMKALAYKRAEQDSELDSMSVQQVREFSELNSITPTNHKQLFSLAVDQLLDLKDWLEQGNDSPYKVWQKAAEETEVRNLIAGQLNKMALGRYNCSQEVELANGQRPDLLMTSIHVKNPVPVELKVLDKGWSGTKLCERLRNQLAGDYLREEEARCGVFLLVWQGVANRSHWEIENKRVKLPELQSVLAQYWNSISTGYPGISNLEILVIDLTIREHKSDT